MRIVIFILLKIAEIASCVLVAVLCILSVANWKWAKRIIERFKKC